MRSAISAWKSQSRHFTSTSKWGKLSLGAVKSCPQPWEKLKIGVIGAPLNLGQPHEGVSKSPALLRSTGVFKQLEDLGHQIHDYGDITGSLTLAENDRYTGVMEFNRQLSQMVKQVLNEDRLCITLGGDHAIGIGTIHGFTQMYPESCLLWIDAHADINTMKNSVSGNMHGMPVAFNIPVPEIQAHFASTKWLQPKLRPERIAYIGLRDVDSPERQIMDKLGIASFSMREIDVMGIRQVTKKAMDLINPDNELPLHVSLDIDVLDPKEAPATGTPVHAGLTLREALTLVEDVIDTGCLRALDLVEVNPDLSDDQGTQQTLQAAKKLLACIGNYRGGRNIE